MVMLTYRLPPATCGMHAVFVAAWLWKPIIQGRNSVKFSPFDPRQQHADLIREQSVAPPNAFEPTRV